MADFAAPILPSSDLDRATAFHCRFGFESGLRLDPDGTMIRAGRDASEVPHG